jgi:putative oxidoreductase
MSVGMTLSSVSNRRITTVDVGLLVLRLGAGVSLFLLFGLTKLKAANSYFHTGAWEFVDFNRKVGLPVPVLIALLQTLNESVGALFVVAGFQTRYAAGSIALGFVAATYLSIRMGEDAWLIALFYAVMFTTLALTGSGKFSIDRVLTLRRSSKE